MNIALKEWASVAAALDAGVQICLLRKGGIVEADRGGFQLRYQRFLLFPTHEHEHSLLLQDSFKQLLLEPVESVHRLSLLCEVTGIATVPQNLSALESASSQFIWNKAFFEKRLNYKPNLPLYAILVRAHRLKDPVEVPDRLSYAGCKSWVHLTEELDVEDAVPVLTDSEYLRRCEILAEVLKLDFVSGDLAVR